MGSEATPSSSNFRRARSLSFRRRTAQRSSNRSRDAIQKEATQEDVDSSPRSDNGRLEVLLRNLNFRLVECTFTYKESHFDTEPRVSPRKRSKLSLLGSKIFGSVEKLRDKITPQNTYSKCLFVPTNEKEKVQDYIRRNFPGLELSFEDCKFMKRGSTLQEKIRRKLRSIFGIQFELEYINARVTIKNYTFRVKDIIFINQHIQERIADEA